MNRPRHGIGWEYNHSAALVRCGDTLIDTVPVFEAWETGTCPVCGVAVRLVWDVHIEELPDVASPPHSAAAGTGGKQVGQ